MNMDEWDDWKDRNAYWYEPALFVAIISVPLTVATLLLWLALWMSS